jgi:D-alanine-D-alanine ligase
MNGAMRVDVIMGGPGREAAVSRDSGAAIAAALVRRGHDVQSIDCAGELDVARLRSKAVAFAIIHGTYGEDGALQRRLEALGRAYVGSDAEASALCMDKERTKARLRQQGIRVPWGALVNLGKPFNPRDLKLPHHGPLVLKPVADGSSVGLRLIANPSFLLPTCEELLREHGAIPYLVEERLPGPEYTVAVLEDGDGRRALPPIRIRPAAGVYDYEAKYHRDDTGYEILGDEAISRRLAQIGVACFNACGCRDFARVDIMATNDGDLAVLELNTLPGFTAHSLTPKAAAAAGIPFDELCERLARRALARAAEEST